MARYPHRQIWPSYCNTVKVQLFWDILSNIHTYASVQLCSMGSWTHSNSAINRRSKIQRLCSDNVPPNFEKGCLEFLLEVIAAHDFGGLGHLSQELFEQSEQTDKATLVDVRHFTNEQVSISLQLHKTVIAGIERTRSPQKISHGPTRKPLP